MKKLLFLILIVSTLFITGCNNLSSRHFGGTQTIDLPAGQKLVNATWKSDDLWYLTRPIRAGEVPEVVTFKEQSNVGILSGTVIFRESK